MGKNIIVSEETIRDLLEAHASMSAWYHALWGALGAVNAGCGDPGDAARMAFMERIAVDFPEVSAVARSIKTPRPYVPAPPAFAVRPPAPNDASRDEQATLIEPAPARLRGSAPPLGVEAPPALEAPPAVEAMPAEPAIAPPPMVNPSKVKYAP